MRKKKAELTCSHIFRSGPLHSSVVIGDGVSMGQCLNLRFPELVVCAEHADKDTLLMLLRMKLKELQSKVAEVVVLRERLEALEKRKGS